MLYKRLNKRSMPPVDNHWFFILWRGVNESDGGVPCLAKRVQYDGKPPYIRFVTPDGWRLLEEKDFPNCRWAELEPPN